MEDFVTLEIAKKLKEKKFPQHWSNDDYIVENDYEDAFEVGCHYDRWFIPEHLPTIAAPTITQVLKWLRDEKKIICLPHINPFEEKWFFYIVILPQASDFPEYMSSIIYNNYEEATLAGIEYVLDKII